VFKPSEKKSFKYVAKLFLLHIFQRNLYAVEYIIKKTKKMRKPKDLRRKVAEAALKIWQRNSSLSVSSEFSMEAR